eukprot:TRINITY_DN2940_c0_g1_i3.p1 TRINITY_DN2940_c0_g1~~TRINITY_DN2940_c0_g1_i3.p1  ORF type:complete len:603 (-),score=131.73 TRINITY_DN2940_c0_g1_i3:17-1825(-)
MKIRWKGILKSIIIVILTVITMLILGFFGEDDDHTIEHFKLNDTVTFTTTSLFSFGSKMPMAFSSLPIGCGDFSPVVEKEPSFVDILTFTTPYTTPFLFDFKKNNYKITPTSCPVVDVDMLKFLIDNEYYMRLFVGSLPVIYELGNKTTESIPIGHKSGDTYYLHTSFYFTVHTREIEKDVLIPITVKAVVLNDFYMIGNPENVEYSATFGQIIHGPTDPEYPISRRWSQYSLGLPTEVKFVSLGTGLIIQALLLLFAYVVFNRAYQRSLDKTKEEEEEDSIFLTELSGWKMLKRDVFRQPTNVRFLNSLISVCLTIFATVLLSIAWNLFNDLSYLFLKNVFIPIFVFYIVATIISSCYLRWRSTIKAFSLLSSLFHILSVPFILFVTVLCLFVIAKLQHGASEPNLLLFVIVVTLIIVSIFPHAIGVLLGSFLPEIKAPIVSADLKRPIPKQPWFLNKVTPFILGIIPSFIIFADIVSFLVDFVNGNSFSISITFILLLFLLYICTIVILTVIYVYYCLNRENYQWQWNSFFVGASTGIYLFLGILYFILRYTQIFDFTMFVWCALFTMLGSLFVGSISAFVSFTSAEVFVHHLYTSVSFK